MVKINKNIVEFKTADDINLCGILLEPQKPIGIVQFNSATAVPKGFYLGLATYLAEKNYTCLVYDYRGICSSQPKTGLKDCEYQLVDWAKQDMEAAYQFLKKKYTELPITFLNHSVGGQLSGMMASINQINGMLCLTTSSGYAGHMPVVSRLRSFYFFEIVRPLIHLIYGYSKFKFLGIMEDMPKNVTNTWQKWCSKPDYFFDKEFTKDLDGLESYKNLKIPIEVFSPIDDPIASRKNVETFWSHIKSSKKINFHWLDPLEYNLKTIGHFGFFSRKSKNSLWPLALKAIEHFYGK